MDINDNIIGWQNLSPEEKALAAAAALLVLRKKAQAICKAVTILFISRLPLKKHINF